MLQISANIQSNGVQFKHHWSTCVGAGRAHEGLMSRWQNQLKMAVEDCNFQYIRFHGLLCDDMALCREEDGKLIYNYTYIDMLFDELLQIGIRPFVEFGFMPKALASGSKTQFWWKGNVTPPKDYSMWTELITNLVTHWLKRYGTQEVLTWYFEIWNEANLSAFWAGTKSDYFRLYEVSVNTIKSIHSDLRVGGPATSNFVPDARFDGEIEDLTKHETHLVDDLQALKWRGVWLEDFLTFCAAKNLPVDFISTHPYPTDFALDGQDTPDTTCEMKGRSRYTHSIVDDLTWLRNLLANSAYINAEIHLTEWSSSPTSRDYSHDYLPAATYIVKSNIDSIGLTNSLSYWVFTDIFEEVGPAPEAFHGGFGLMTIHNIKKPAYHAYRFLNQLGHELVDKNEYGIFTKNSSGKLRGLLYHYPEEMSSAVPIAEYPNHEKAEAIQNMGVPLDAKVTLTDFSPNQSFTLEILDANHGNATTLWKHMKYPQNLTLEQQTELIAFSEALELQIITADSQGILTLDLNLNPWSIISISEN